MFGESHLRGALSSYAEYCNQVRTNSAVAKDAAGASSTAVISSPATRYLALLRF
jgi:hypothetical protein